LDKRLPSEALPRVGSAPHPRRHVGGAGKVAARALQEADLQKESGREELVRLLFLDGLGEEARGDGALIKSFARAYLRRSFWTDYPPDSKNPFKRLGAYGLALDLPAAPVPEGAVVRNLLTMWSRVVTNH
jgi:hypothetical protein